jgi:plasmid stability protein
MKSRCERIDDWAVDSNFETVKNITLSVDDAVYQAARVEAAKRHRSLSGIVRAYLNAFVQGTAPVLPAPEADRENREKLVRLLSECRLELGFKPSRTKTYEGGRFSRY